MAKYADDTYLIIPASVVHTRATEINNITTWAIRNNLTLNMAKTTEIVIYDSRRKQQDMPPPLPGIARVDSLRVFECSGEKKFENRSIFGEDIDKII